MGDAVLDELHDEIRPLPFGLARFKDPGDMGRFIRASARRSELKRATI
jgi:hypothetical protein